MAIIDVDRHIISDLITIFKQIDKKILTAQLGFDKLREYDAKEVSFCLEKDCDRFYKTRVKKDKKIRATMATWEQIVKLHSESSALLLHILNRVIEVDTGKGEEYTRHNGKNNNGKNKKSTNKHIS